MSINRVIISGNLTRDPELRSTGSGMPVIQFGVAVNDRRKNQQTGEWEDYPNFVDCTMFGARAEAVNRYLTKGAKVSIEGKLRWSQWEKDGQKRSKIEVIVDELEFMSAKRDEAAQDPAPAYAAPQYQAQQYQPQYAPQMAPQQGYAPPMQQMPQQMPQQMAMPQYQQPAYMPQQAPLYDEDIPF